jgi:hypothetical protein
MIYEFYCPNNMQYTNESLLRSGFVGATPLYPNVAVSIRTLEDHWQTHCVCPCLSIQAMVHKLYHLHNVCFSVLLIIVSSAKANVISSIPMPSIQWHIWHIPGNTTPGKSLQVPNLLGIRFLCTRCPCSDIMMLPDYIHRRHCNVCVYR